MKIKILKKKNLKLRMDIKFQTAFSFELNSNQIIMKLILIESIN